MLFRLLLFLFLCIPYLFSTMKLHIVIQSIVVPSVALAFSSSPPYVSHRLSNCGVFKTYMAEEDQDDELPSGSFFHQVPEQSNADNDGLKSDEKLIESLQDPSNNEGEEFDLSLKKAMDLRTTSIAKTESTIGGKPSKGFGKKSQKKEVSVKKKSSYVEISDMVW